MALFMFSSGCLTQTNSFQPTVQFLIFFKKKIVRLRFSSTVDASAITMAALKDRIGKQASGDDEFVLIDVRSVSLSGCVCVCVCVCVARTRMCIAIKRGSALIASACLRSPHSPQITGHHRGNRHD